MKHILSNQLLVVVLILLLGWFLLSVQGIIVALFAAYIVMASLRPFIELMARNGIPRAIGVLLCLIVGISSVVLLILPLIPFFSSQLETFFQVLPNYLDTLLKVANVQVSSAQLRNTFFSQVNELGRNAVGVTSAVFGGFFTVLMILFASFYLLVDHDQIEGFFSALLPLSKRQRFIDAIHVAELKLGAWFRGQVVLSVFIGVFTWIALSLIGLPFALPLALIAGIFEMIPTVGPILSAVPAIIVAFTISGNMALIAVGFYLFIQALENNILVPKVMEKAVGLHPLAIVLAIAIGAKLIGIVGALLAVPFLAFLYTFYTHFSVKK